MKPPVILVNMPWAMLRAPSLQLSTIKALLARHGIIASVLNKSREVRRQRDEQAAFANH